uniref:Uncharacterized protein n=1 Tax=Arundo donax TaxID=35708 RepID=A0A0A9AXP8_ARUDO
MWSAESMWSDLVPIGLKTQK